MISRRTAACAAAIFAMAAATSCNLDLETEDYPYRVPLVIDDDTGGTTTPDAGNNTTPDMGDPPDMAPPGTPRLVITEVLINTSFMDSSVALGELGEFVELKNVGDGPADPRSISMRLTNISNDSTGDIFVATAVSQEQLEIIRGLKPVEPGDYFVFVRHSVPEVPVTRTLEEGRSYDFGRYGEGAAISNSDERVLEVRYNDGETIVTSDRIRWRNSNVIAANGDASDSLAYEEDISITVMPGNESPELNDTPDTWCLSADTIGSVNASPGTAGTCQ